MSAPVVWGSVLFLAGVACVVVAGIVALVALIRIAASKGRLRGAGYAVAAIVLCPVLLCGGGVVLFAGGAPKTRSAPAPEPRVDVWDESERRERLGPRIEDFMIRSQDLPEGHRVRSGRRVSGAALLREVLPAPFDPGDAVAAWTGSIAPGEAAVLLVELADEEKAEAAREKMRLHLSMVTPVGKPYSYDSHGRFVWGVSGDPAEVDVVAKAFAIKAARYRK